MGGKWKGEKKEGKLNQSIFTQLLKNTLSTLV
jgi:hypothetical protein